MRSCAAAITMRFAACHIHCFANHNGSNAQNRRGPSGDHARRSPFWRLWVLRLPLQRARGPAATTRAAGPSAVSGHCIALQIPMAATHRTAGGPAATTRAAVPSGGSGSCACHCRERGAHRRPRAPQALLQSLEAVGTAPATAKSEGPSGDHARRRPFWRLWVLRLPLQRARGPAATTRAAGPSAVSRHCGEQGAQRRPRAPPLQRARGPARRPRAPQALLEALGTAPASGVSE